MLPHLQRVSDDGHNLTKLTTPFPRNIAFASPYYIRHTSESPLEIFLNI
jgi:hypothetical protein